MTTPGDDARRLAHRLLAPIDIAGIVYYRIAFGAIALWEIYRYASRGWIDRYYIRPEFHFSDYGFDWISPWPGDGMCRHFAALGLLAFGILIGFCYRVSAGVDDVRAGALYCFNMFMYNDSDLTLGIQAYLNAGGDEKELGQPGFKPDLTKRSAIRSVFDGRYEYSRYFSLGTSGSIRRAPCLGAIAVIQRVACGWL